MKKTIFVLPLCVFLTFCSSSKKATTPPAGPGISNVNVGRGDTMTSAATASSSFTPADRDWAYTANRDTTLSGTWTLDGILSANGSWTSTVDSSTAATTTTTTTDTAMSMMSTDTTTTTAATATSKKSKKYKNKTNRKALYDSAQARLKLNYKDTTVLDTTVQPYKYWTAKPTLSLNASKAIFTGNTGCNSMSGSFNFSKTDIQFGRNIVTSKMSCNEYDEANFLAALKKADSYTLEGNVLQLKQGNTVLLTFHKS